jgi:hypothetical protein
MIFGSLGLLVAAGGLLAAGIADSNTGLLIGSFACTALAGVLLLIAYAAARGGAPLGAAQAGTAAPMALPGAAPGAIPPGTQPVLMYVPVSQVPGALQPVGAAPGGNGSSLPGVDNEAFAPAPPFLGYDDMTADQVVKLVGSGALTEDQLAALREYERKAQARKTVLDRLDKALR